MSSTELVRREPRPTGKRVIPRQMLAKREPTVLDYAWIYQEVFGLLAAVVGFVWSLVLLCVKGPTPYGGNLVWTGAMFLFIVLGGVSIGRGVREIGSGSDEKKSIEVVRRDAVVADRGRVAAAHAPERASRAEDVDHAQFSVRVERQGSEIVVGITRHKDGVGRRVWRTHENAASGYITAAGRWGTQTEVVDKFRETKRTTWVPNPERPWAVFNGKDVRLTEPTLDRVAEVVEDMAEIAALLERQSYADALAARKLERLALVFAPPPSGARERALVHGDEIDDELSTLTD